MTKFSDFALDEAIQKNLEKMGFETPTDVQVEAIPPVLEKKDVVMNSHTGSGKTGAFLIPFIQNVRLDIPAAQYLILVPTRELAAQIKLEAEKITENTEVKTACIYGGMPFNAQVNAIKDGAQIIVGTPGRILDHLKRRTLSLSVVRGLVLDEGDKMLSMGFLPEVKLIMDYLPKRHQTVLSSATFPPAIELIIEQYMIEPTRIQLTTQAQTAQEISHYFALVGLNEKEQTLLAFLEKEDPTLSLIFCNTKIEVNSVYQFLKHAGLSVESLSSDHAQRKREEVLHGLRVGQVSHLVCTDLAARGIDIPHLSHVFVFSAGEDLEAYVHRTGRTGRAGRAGKAISIVSGQDIANFNMALKVHEISATEISAPTDEEVTESRSANYFKQLETLGFAGEADVHDEFTQIASKLKKKQITSLLPFLLERFFKTPKVLDWARKETKPAQPSADYPDRNRKRPSDHSRNRRPDRADRPERADRSERADRPERAERSETKTSDKPFRGQAMCLALGSKDGLDEGTLQSILKKQGNLRHYQIGKIEIFDYECFFEVYTGAVKTVLRANGRHYRHHEIRIEKSPVPFDKIGQYKDLTPESEVCNATDVKEE